MNNLGIVKRNIVRADPAAVRTTVALRRGDRARGHGPGRAGPAVPAPDLPRGHVCGPAVTVLLHPGDNWMLHVAAEQVRRATWSWPR